MKTEMAECYKCGGSGYISAFSGIANGVCFRCKGAGKIAYRPTKKVVKPMTAYQAEMIDAISNGIMEGLSYGRLNELRNFAHWPCEFCPNILAIWRERGEQYFQAAQERRLQSMGYA